MSFIKNIIASWQGKDSPTVPVRFGRMRLSPSIYFEELNEWILSLIWTHADLDSAALAASGDPAEGNLIAFCRPSATHAALT